MKGELIKLLDKAYAPYSNFRVAAILEMKDGKYIPGVNVENASYGASICAERNAITTAVSMGYKKGDFKNLYLMVSGSKLSMPCFMCRELLHEYFLPDSKVFCYNNRGKCKEFKISDICPYPFNLED